MSNGAAPPQPRRVPGPVRVTKPGAGPAEEKLSLKTAKKEKKNLWPVWIFYIVFVV